MSYLAGGYGLVRGGIRLGAKVLARRGAKKETDDALRTLPRGKPELTQERLEHIVHRHGASSGWRGKSKFSPGTGARDIRSMIDEAAQHGTSRPNTRGRPGQIYEHGFDRAIGTSGGRSTSSLRVIVDPKGRVVTAFPHRP